MKICVLSSGVVHAVPRTISFAKYFKHIHFIDTKGNADRATLDKNNIHYHTIDNGNRLQVLKILKILKDFNPDGIICHYAFGNHFFASVLYGKCPVAVIAMGHDILYDKGDTPISALKKAQTRMALKMSDLICAKSTTLKNRIVGFGIKTNIPVIYWGSDLTKFKPADKIELRQKLGYKTAQQIILSPRAVEPRCNIHLIVDAFSELVKELPNALLILIGRTEPSYQRHVEALIEKYNLHTNMECIYEVGQDQLLDYYSICDVIVSMAHSEGFPNTVLEGMACNRPIIIGDIPQIRELLVDNYNAKICSFDKHSISNGILDILNDTKKSEFLSKNGKEIALQHGNIAKNGKIFAELFNSRVPTFKTKNFMRLLFFLLLITNFFTRSMENLINVLRRIFVDKITT